MTTKKVDGRTVRGNVRRSVWQHAADAVDDLPEVEMGEDEQLTKLYRATREALVRWMRQRGRGVLGPPPGGVGTRGGR